MDYESLLSLAKNCRSVRRYRPEPVPMDILTKVLEVARWAPSGDNSQPWEFVVVRDPEKVQQVRDILDEGTEQIRKSCPRFTFLHPSFKEMSAFILVCVDPRFKWAYPRSPESDELATMYEENSERILLESVSIAVTYLRLAATSLGLGTVWISGAAERITERKLKEAFNIPQELRVFCCLPIGHPAKLQQNPLSASARHPRPLEDLIHPEKFDTSKCRSDEDVAKLTDKDRKFWSKFYKTGRMD